MPHKLLLDEYLVITDLVLPQKQLLISSNSYLRACSENDDDDNETNLEYTRPMMMIRIAIRRMGMMESVLRPKKIKGYVCGYMTPPPQKGSVGRLFFQIIFFADCQVF